MDDNSRCHKNHRTFLPRYEHCVSCQNVKKATELCSVTERYHCVNMVRNQDVTAVPTEAQPQDGTKPSSHFVADLAFANHCNLDSELKV